MHKVIFSNCHSLSCSSLFFFMIFFFFTCSMPAAIVNGLWHNHYCVRTILLPFFFLSTLKQAPGQLRNVKRRKGLFSTLTTNSGRIIPAARPFLCFFISFSLMSFYFVCGSTLRCSLYNKVKYVKPSYRSLMAVEEGGGG